MKINILFGCVITAIPFGLWNVVLKRSELPVFQNMVVFSGVTLAVVAVPFLSKNPSWLWVVCPTLVVAGVMYLVTHGMPNSETFYALRPAVLAGILNGIGTISWIWVMGLVPKTEVAKTSFAMISIMLAANAVGAHQILGEIFPRRRLAGIAAAIIAAILLVL